MPAITGQILMNMGKQLLKSMTKKAVKATVKKKKVKGKDVAKKMFGGEEKGGALTLRPKVDIVPSPAGELSKTEAGGEIVKSGSKKAAELGLTKFMDSVNSIQTSVESVKLALNDNKESALARIEDQRLINAKIKKDDREAELEAKKPKKNKGPLSGAKDAADNFLARMAKFATMTLLGSLIAALMGGARDVILAFRIGIEAIKKGLPTLLKGVKALKAGIGKAFNLALRPFKSLGNLVLKGFKAVGSKLFGMVKWAKGIVVNAVRTIVNAGAKAFPKVAQMVTNTTKSAGTIINQGKTLVQNVGSKAKNVVKNVGGRVSKIIGKLFGKQAGKAAAGPGIKTLFKSMAKGAKAIKIPVVGPLLVALMSMFAGDPMKQTLFKTAGAAIGGGLGLALGPIGMIVGEIAGEFVGDVLYTGFSGEAGGWKAAGKKLKDKFFQIVKGGKVVLNWIGNGFGRFFKNFVEEHKIPIPKGGGVQTILGKILPFLADKDGLVTSIPNIFQLYNPFKMGPLLLKSFFPPKDEGSSEGGDTAASIGEQSNGNSVDVESISESASYEDGAEGEPTVVIDGGGGDQASSPTPQAGKTRLISLGLDKQTILNSQYEMSSNAALYKV